MIYSEEIIEEVRSRNDIFVIVSEYVKLKKSGNYYFGICPFHGEKTPSFTVTPSKQIFYCYGCSKGGNVFNFIMEMENFTFPDAVKYLAEKVNYTLPETSDDKENERVKIKNTIIKINKEAARYYFLNLTEKENKKAFDYLFERKLDKVCVKKFGIGYATESWDSLYNYLKKIGYNDEIILNSGLCIRSKKGNLYDRFRNRIIFPIIDLSNVVLGFGGRSIDGTMPKYMNSPETILYNKRNILYNLNYAKNYCKEQLIIVEGYMDVISLFKNKIMNVVAPLGTSLTEGHVRLINRYTEEVILLYDSDEAGKNATLRALNLLNLQQCDSRVVQLEGCKDPDEFINKYGVEKFNEYLKKSLNYIEYKINVAKAGLNIEDTEGRVKFINRIAEILSKVSNEIEKEMYISSISKRFNISEKSLQLVINRKNEKNEKILFNKEKIKKENKSEEKSEVLDEIILLGLILNDNNLYNLVKNIIKPEDFIDGNNKKIANRIFSKINKGILVSSAEIYNEMENNLASSFARILETKCNILDKKKAALDYANKIKSLKSTKRIEEIINLLKNEKNLPEGDVIKLKQEWKDLLTKKIGK